jgi:hypothetical protein
MVGVFSQEKRKSIKQSLRRLSLMVMGLTLFVKKHLQGSLDLVFSAIPAYFFQITPSDRLF